ncbi:MAG TPA: Pvc16 family protein, partial [Polyangiaceae bacterium]|nr:Pvc16 family protein [Polyangiaceae bacterium]
MSNSRAVAAVTAALRALLTPAAAIVPGAQITHLRPDAVAQDQQSRGINVYLYMVRPNPHHSTEQLPARRSDGSLYHRVLTVLDLHYLLSFYGSDARLEPQLLLGAASLALRE